MFNSFIIYEGEKIKETVLPTQFTLLPSVPYLP